MNALPLSVSQERHLLTEEYHARTGSPPTVWNFVECRRLRGTVDMAALAAAIHRLIQHRTALRVAAVPDDSYSAEQRRTHVERFLSSTVGSEAWNSRDLKSRPH